jgi:hypothetical protein
VAKTAWGLPQQYRFDVLAIAVEGPPTLPEEGWCQFIEEDGFTEETAESPAYQI